MSGSKPVSNVSKLLPAGREGTVAVGKMGEAGKKVLAAGIFSGRLKSTLVTW